MARLLHLWYLLQKGYSSALFIPFSKYVNASRSDYYKAYSRVDENAAVSRVTDITPFVAYFIQSIYNQLAQTESEITVSAIYEDALHGSTCRLFLRQFQRQFSHDLKPVRHNGSDPGGPFRLYRRRDRKFEGDGQHHGFRQLSLHERIVWRVCRRTGGDLSRDDSQLREQYFDQCVGYEQQRDVCRRTDRPEQLGLQLPH